MEVLYRRDSRRNGESKSLLVKAGVGALRAEMCAEGTLYPQWWSHLSVRCIEAQFSYTYSSIV